MLKNRFAFWLALGWLHLLGIVPAGAQDCPPLKQVTSVDLLSWQNGISFVPITINGTPKLMLLDTGGYISQLSPEAVKQLNLTIFESNRELHNVSGNTSHQGVYAESLTLGSLTAAHLPLMVSPSELGMADGLLSGDLLVRYDIELDYGAHKLSYFSPDHCAGKVVHWPAEQIAEVPLTLRDRSHVFVEVKLDGKPFLALIDTGATRTVITKSVARSIFGLDTDSPGMTPAGPVNGDHRLQGFEHKFSSLAFEGVNVTVPNLLIVPDHSGGTALQTGSHISGDPGVKLPDLTLGMDVLKHLHLYLAFKEQKLYVSAATPSSDAAGTDAQWRTLVQLDKALALSPTNATLLNNRCFQRGMENTQLEAGLEDCEASLRISPAHATTLDSKGFVLFRLGRFQEALAVYDAALKLDPKMAPSLYMRGQTRRKLGNMAGGEIRYRGCQSDRCGSARRISRDWPRRLTRKITASPLRETG